MPITRAIVSGESAFSMTRADLLAHIGSKMSGGVDYDPTNWDAKQTRDAMSVLNSGLRLFYGAYDW